MPKRSTSKSRNSSALTRAKSIAGDGNVFSDLGFKNPYEMALKSDLVWHINRAIDERGVTQAEAGKLLGINQPKVSALRRGQLTDFSVDRLIRFLVSLGQAVDIRVRPSTRAGVRVLKKAG